MKTKKDLNTARLTTPSATPIAGSRRSRGVRARRHPSRPSRRAAGAINTGPRGRRSRRRPARPGPSRGLRRRSGRSRTAVSEGHVWASRPSDTAQGPAVADRGPLSSLEPAWPSAAGGQTSAHLLVHGLDPLQGPHHDAELDDPARVVAPDDVDAVHVLTLHARLELEHRGVPGEDLLRVVESASGPTGQRPGRRLEVLRRDGLPALWRVDHRRVEDDVVGEQLVKTAGELPSQVPVPAGDRVVDHGASSSSPVVRGRARHRSCPSRTAPQSPTAGLLVPRTSYDASPASLRACSSGWSP